MHRSIGRRVRDYPQQRKQAETAAQEAFPPPINAVRIYFVHKPSFLIVKITVKGQTSGIPSHWLCFLLLA